MGVYFVGGNNRARSYCKQSALARRPKSFAFQYPSHNFLLKTIINRFLNAKTFSGSSLLDYHNQNKTPCWVSILLVGTIGLEPMTLCL